MCKYCEFPRDIKISNSPLDKELQPDTAIILDKGIVLLKNHRAFGFFDINYCPFCGEKLREDCIEEG